MPANKDFQLFKDFLGHLITGGVLFLSAAAVSILLETAAHFIDKFPDLWLIAIVFRVIAYLILVLDVGCLVFFLVIRAYRFIKDTWTSRGS
jgi:hypothetical protein